MITWEDYKEVAKARGCLALELYAAISTPAKEPQDPEASLAEHLAYQTELERRKALAFAGPMSDETGTFMQGIGLIIYRAESLAAARALADADPMHKSGERTYVLRRWLVNEGSFTLSVGLSTNHVTLR